VGKFAGKETGEEAIVGVLVIDSAGWQAMASNTISTR